MSLLDRLRSRARGRGKRSRVAPAPLACQELVELITDYLEGALPAPDRARFNAHIAECQGCTNYLDQMRTTIEALGRLSETDVPPEAMDELLAAFRSWKRG